MKLTVMKQGVWWHYVDPVTERPRTGDHTWAVCGIQINGRPLNWDQHDIPVGEGVCAACERATESAVNHPPHYNKHPSGIECITIVEHFNFNIGNAIKYAWRAGLKSADAIEDLKKGRWYLDREIERLTQERSEKK